MKILYGVQGTGNGHITRARVMAKAFAKHDINVDWIFSGRARKDYFDMQCFGNYRCFRGLTFITSNGKIDILKTAQQLSFRQLYRDVKHLDLASYDVIISDFEPVTAWAAKRAKRETFGLSHQSAFQFSIPTKGSNLMTRLIMRWFAPVTHPIGLHWHHFNQIILPPVIDTELHKNVPPCNKQHVLVYFPFQSLEKLVELVRPFDQHQFYIYHQVAASIDQGHIHIRPFSRDGFQQDLAKTHAIICGAGFELPSEALHLGKRLLVQPVAGQMEQLSNAKVLKELGLATTCDEFNYQQLGTWLNQKSPPKVPFPDTAGALASWIAKGANIDDLEALAAQLWQQTKPLDLTNLEFTSA